MGVGEDYFNEGVLDTECIAEVKTLLVNKGT